MTLTGARPEDGFVDDVPGVDTVFVAGSDGADVVGEDGDGVVRGDGGVEPGRIVFVPAEIVATHEELVGFGEGGEEIGLGEVEAVGGGMRGGPLHLIFGDEDGALVEEERSEFGAVELGVGDCGAEEERAGEAEFAEVGDGGSGRLLRESGGGEGRGGESEEVAAMHGGKDRWFGINCHDDARQPSVHS